MIITLEENLCLVYNEATRQIRFYTPLLFINSLDHRDSVEAIGCCVLFKNENGYYLITAAHCIKQSDIQIKIGIMDHLDFHLIQGKVVLFKGDEDKIDIGVIKLQQNSIE